MYNLAVAREFLKQVYVAERLQPPSWNTVTSAYNTIFARARNPAYWREIINSGEWVKVGIYGVEAYGVFKVSCASLCLTYLPLFFSPCGLISIQNKLY